MQGFGFSVWAVGGCGVVVCLRHCLLLVFGVAVLVCGGCCFLLVSGGLSCVVGCGVWVLGGYLFGLAVVC